MNELTSQLDPPFRAGGQLERFATPEGYYDEPFDYFFTFTIPSGMTQENLPMQFEDDAEFIWRSMVGDFTGSGLAEAQFIDAIGRALSADYVIWDDYVGSLFPNTPTPIEANGIGVHVPASGQLRVNLRESSSLGSVTVRMSLYGVKRYKRK